MTQGEKIIMTGASGPVGRSLLPVLAANGFEVIRLVRREPRDAGEARWDLAAGSIDEAALAGAVGAIHLAGDNIAEGRWTDAKKRRVRESRVRGTEVLAAALARQSPLPRFMISASAIGYYGDRGDEVVDEGSNPGDGFLASVCKDWEAATAAAEEAGIRVVHARIGIVLAAGGGALAKMKTPFQLGVGGRIGDGRQYMSWIALDDVVSSFLFAATTDTLRGPVNLVAPDPVTNSEFTTTLGRVLGRPTMFPVPKFAMRLALGAEMADEMLLGGARVVPKRLHDAGFEWQYETLEGALSAAL